MVLVAILLAQGKAKSACGSDGQLTRVWSTATLYNLGSALRGRLHDVLRSAHNFSYLPLQRTGSVDEKLKARQLMTTFTNAAGDIFFYAVSRGDAPVGAPSDIPWARLDSKFGDMKQVMYRVLTSGGAYANPRGCDAQASYQDVPFSAQYWVYGPPSLGRAFSEAPLCSPAAAGRSQGQS
jgi:hypothetical protein